MSFDLAVFDPARVPQDRAAFLEWWRQVSHWDDEAHDYNNPDSTSPALKAWFLEMIAEFPAMNGPYAKSELPPDEVTLTDYTIAKEVVYAAFAWSKAEDAGDAVIRLAQRHGLGLFNVSSPSAEVYLPDSSGELQLAHSDQ